MTTTIRKTTRRKRKGRNETKQKRKSNTKGQKKFHHIPNSTQGSDMKRNDPPVFTLGSDTKLLDLALDSRERFSGDAEVEELCFDELV